MTQEEAKPLILHSHEVRQALKHGSLLCVRPVKPQIVDRILPGEEDTGMKGFFWTFPNGEEELLEVPHDWEEMATFCPLGPIGGECWVRETFAYVDCQIHDFGSLPKGTNGIYPLANDFEFFNVRYAATDDQAWDSEWRPSSQMPRWASRLTLKIKNIKVKRVQEISDHELLGRIGWHGPGRAIDHEDAMKWFEATWDTHYTSYPWDLNPWAWFVELERIEE